MILTQDSGRPSQLPAQVLNRLEQRAFAGGAVGACVAGDVDCHALRFQLRAAAHDPLAHFLERDDPFRVLVTVVGHL